MPTIDDVLDAARAWTRGTTLSEYTAGPRAWCALMIEEIEWLRARVAMLEDAENAGTAITAMPIQIGDDLCYLPINAHGIVKRALRDAERIDWLSRSDDEPVYIPPMIAIPDDLHPDELAGFERGAQMALNYVHNMGPLYTASVMISQRKRDAEICRAVHRQSRQRVELALLCAREIEADFIA